MTAQPNTAIDLDALIDAILASIGTAFPVFETVEAYREDRRRALSSGRFSAPQTAALGRLAPSHHRATTAGGVMGWVCTTAGYPGTWKTFGAITP